jgi:type IV pilus assembly protein PilM
VSSIWKKEISLRKKPAATEPAAPDALDVAADAVAADDTAELPRGDYGWLTANFDPDEVPENMPTVSAPPVAPVERVAEPAAPGPAQAPELPVAAAPKQQPFWKKELSLSRGPKQPRKPKEKKAKQEKVSKPPFWKRELSFGKGKGKAEAKDPAEPKQKKQKKVKQAKAPKPVAPAKGGVVGLKIGASQVAAARVTNANGAPQLLQVARVELPEGVVVGGELRDVEGLGEALKELFAKNKLPKRGVRLGIANNRIGVRTFEIAGIEDPRQLANAIRFRAQETLPIPLEEAVLDWQVLSERVDEETGQLVRRVLLVVAYRELVDRYVMACHKAGIRLAGIDLEAFAMLRALTAPPAADAPAANGAQVVVNVGHDRSTFAVSDGRVCEFTRVLAWGGHNLSVAIARALDMTPSEARPIKHALSLVATFAPPEGVPVEAMNTAREVVSRELQSFARELVSSLRFYQNQPGSLGIGEVVLTGGTAHLPGLADELHRLIGVPVRVGDPLNRVALAKKFRESDEYAIGSLTVAIGLGIDD